MSLKVLGLSSVPVARWAVKICLWFGQDEMSGLASPLFLLESCLK